MNIQLFLLWNPGNTITNLKVVLFVAEPKILKMSYFAT